MSKLEEAMLKHIHYIVNNEYRPFSFRDLLRFQVDEVSYNSSHGTIRNKLSKFSKEGKIELCYIDTIAFYSLPGRKFGKYKLMTDNPTDVINYNNNNKHELYKSIRKHPLFNMLKYSFGKSSLHDIQLSFQSRGLWDFLASIEYYKQRINPDNRGILFGYYQIERYLAIQVNVQNTDTVNVIVKCSTNPIMLDFDGVMRLTEALTRIEERLSAVVNDPSNKTFNAEYNPSEIKIPTKDDWAITLWHLHRDSYEEYSGEKFQCCWKIAKNLFIRIYSKELKLNRNIIRLEIQENPDILFKNLLVEFIRNDNYQRLIELLV